MIQERIATARNGSPIFRIDGPFGAASEDVWDYPYCMLIAAGMVAAVVLSECLPRPRHSLFDVAECLRE